VRPAATAAAGLPVMFPSGRNVVYCEATSNAVTAPRPSRSPTWIGGRVSSTSTEVKIRFAYAVRHPARDAAVQLNDRAGAASPAATATADPPLDPPGECVSDHRGARRSRPGALGVRPQPQFGHAGAADDHRPGRPQPRHDRTTLVSSLPAHACPQVSRAELIARAKSWLTAGPGGGPVPCSQTSRFQEYRQDCSGYVSTAARIDKPGKITVDLADHLHSTSISMAELRWATSS
jgi:hypothetical protein